jgi:hypothetical protein
MVTGVAGSIVGGGVGSTSGEIHGMQVAQHLNGSGDDSVEVSTGSDSGEAGGAGSMSFLRSRGATR